MAIFLERLLIWWLLSVGCRPTTAPPPLLRAPIIWNRRNTHLPHHNAQLRFSAFFFSGRFDEPILHSIHNSEMKLEILLIRNVSAIHNACARYTDSECCFFILCAKNSPQHIRAKFAPDAGNKLMYSWNSPFSCHSRWYFRIWLLEI